jgi:hypothetical protein
MAKIKQACTASDINIDNGRISDHKIIAKNPNTKSKQPSIKIGGIEIGRIKKITFYLLYKATDRIEKHRNSYEHPS